MNRNGTYPVYKLGNFTLGGGNIFKCLVAYSLIFLFFFVFYVIKGYSDPVPGFMIFLQFFYFIFYTSSLIGAYKIKFSRKEFYLFVLIYSLIAGFLIRALSWEFLNEPFLGGVDSVKYDTWGNLALTKDLSYSEYIQMIKDQGFGTDDLGMTTIVYYVYNIFGNGRSGQNVLIVFNSFVITGCAWRLDGIMRYYEIDKYIRRFCVAVYAFFPFLSLTAGVGLKENFFLFVIISAFYYMFRQKETKKFKYFVFSFLFILATIFFRVATFAMMVLCYLVCMISKPSNKKRIMWLIILGIVCSLFALNIALNILFGRGLDAFLAIANARSGQVDEGVGSVGKWVVSFLALFFGPYPNFSKLSEYAIVHSSGVLLKAVLGFPIIYGLWVCCRKYLYKFYPLFLYFLLNGAMVVLVGVSLDMRYQLPFFPLTLPFAGKILQNKNLKTLFLLYILVLFILTWFYNKR